MFIWPIGIIWHWESGGLRAIHIYVIDFQEISQGSGFLLHKFWWPLTPHFLTAKLSLWVIWTSLHGYFFSASFFYLSPFGWSVMRVKQVCTKIKPAWSTPPARAWLEMATATTIFSGLPSTNWSWTWLQSWRRCCTSPTVRGRWCWRWAKWPPALLTQRLPLR